jgi:signal transduction histidine kinase
MSLRGLFSGIAAVILVLGLMAAAALVTITSRMQTNSALLRNAMESVRAAEELESTLLLHYRERGLLGLTGEERHAEVMRSTEGHLHAYLNEAQRLVGSPEEVAVLQELRERITEYLESADQPRAEGQEALEGALLDQALVRVERLSEINLAYARRTESEARQWEELAHTLGAMVAAALLAGLSLSLWLLRREVYQPLLSIRQAMVHFRPGPAGVAAPEAGALELREIAREFNRMTERLMRQREVQLSSIAGVAHDLRKPLSTLKLSAAAVRPDRPLPPEEKLHERFGVVRHQVERIERMVEELLDTARIEAGKLELRLEPHDLVGLLREAVTLHEAVSPAHPLVLQSPQGPLLVPCDSLRIMQVLNNLLSNAIKYSPRGGQVRVELTPRPDEVWVAVTDSGVGIPAEERESIFEPFRRSSVTRDTIPGVGLGLAVGRRIVEAHGGHIEVQSELGAGSTFRIRLPLQSPRGGGH